MLFLPWGLRDRGTGWRGVGKALQLLFQFRDFRAKAPAAEFPCLPFFPVSPRRE